MPDRDERRKSLRIIARRLAISGNVLRHEEADVRVVFSFFLLISLTPLLEGTVYLRIAFHKY